MKTNYEKNGGNGGSTRNRLDTLAETLGVHITYHRAGQPGWYNHHRKQISLRHGMSTPQENSVLAHELGHAIHGDLGHGDTRQENRADRFAANLLITEDEYRQAEMLYGPHPGAIAHELGVTNHLVAVWRNTHRPATPVN
ncbi:ImmA/IrrE family metallo-endopeptidase [Corynebacterium sp. MC-04]|uniref:ImmA/IrrE family metallo-endopeptidase n=1 Tax=Corynebacterium parakroppenstedtii TaxID=2828363 RepID=A0ABS9HPA7_9CORY|nr:ImmA/IrrE family metallo-endopeptidase [Corynebacterium parakroppenstedtii]MDU3198329.1 ImmA/IrrE family metallo-endopeptidase [Corynebacterium kroppenstedtii]MBY0789572.1 ImmA/IrrE family metallo-endopeptidase [Corynebacterium parakroppenstedtii]MBY0793401.1 ImmA/IrrE family metallo-endopeptidase [Corynebacterium parakroppenstedtii]MCF6770645.1 ImmA/IrrE family metallo-endopeptidase [Corynebacterium parakroppenstedtii]MCF6772364.1 ImmA/IrrE family metallo-endopeptidase [Corynebacterium par